MVISSTQELQAKPSLQELRFQAPLAKIKTLLSSSTQLDEVLEKLTKEGRGPAFALEALSKIYEQTYPDTLGKFRTLAKEFEDELGHYIDANEHIKFADSLKWTTPNGKMPVEVRAELEKVRNSQKKQFVQFLKNKEWIVFQTGSETQIDKENHPILDWVDKKLKKTEWEGKNQDRLTVLNFLNQDLKTNLEQADYDMNDLQNGLHKFRRELRWVLIFLQALDGSVAFTDLPIQGFEDIRNDKKVTESPYSKHSDVTAKYPVGFLQTAFLTLTKMVNDLGVAKDMGEARFEWLKEAIETSKYREGAGAEELARELVQSHSQYVEGKVIADKIYRTVKETQLIPKTRAYLKEQRDWSKEDCLRALGKTA